MTLIRKLKIYGFKRFLGFAFSEIYRTIFFKIIKGSYSQDAEDIIMDQYLGFKKNGIVVDIGANDGVRFSNSYRFSKKGWRCVNVEPNIILYKKLCKTRKKDININMGIGKKGDNITFYRIFPETLGTFSKEQANGYIKKGYQMIETLSIQMMSLEELFDNFIGNDHIDILSVDTEGYDLEVLRSNNWEKYRPNVLCIERTENRDTVAYIKTLGYNKLKETCVNDIYVLK